MEEESGLSDRMAKGGGYASCLPAPSPRRETPNAVEMLEISPYE